MSQTAPWKGEAVASSTAVFSSLSDASSAFPALHGYFYSHLHQAQPALAETSRSLKPGFNHGNSPPKVKKEQSVQTTSPLELASPVLGSPLANAAASAQAQSSHKA